MESFKIDTDFFSITSQVSNSNGVNVWNATLKDGRKCLAHFMPNSVSKNRCYSLCTLLSQLKHPNILKFIGFSESEQFTIITEGGREGSLSEFMKNKRNTLNNNEKKLISLGIARSLAYLHERSVFVSHLTPEIVFLDEEKDPKLDISGIGLIGPPSYCAPELSTDQKEDSRSDVFLYSFILFELLTGLKPFKGMSHNDIMNSIVRDKMRPSIPKHYPAQIVEIIRKSWSASKSHRPSLTEIIQMLDNGSISFHTEIQMPPSHLFSSTKPIQNNHNDVNMKFNTQKNSRPAKVDEPYHKNQIDPSNPLFGPSLITKASNTEKNDLMTLYQSLLPYMGPNSTNNTIKIILNAIIITLKSPESCKMLMDSKIIQNLPYDSSDLLDDIFDIINLLFSYSPSSFNENYLLLLSYLLNKDPNRFIVFISHYAKKFGEISNPWPILDLLLANYSLFFSLDCGSQYLSVLFYLNFNYSEYYQRRINECRPIFSRFMKSKVINSAKTAYNSIFSLYDELFNVSFDQIESDLKSKEMNQYALGLLMKIPTIPANKQIINQVYKLARKNKNASLVLFKILEDEESAKLFVQIPSWICDELPTLSHTLRVFFSIMRHESLRAYISELDDITKLLVNISLSKDRQIMLCLSVAIKYIELNNQTISLLSNNGFFSNLMSRLQQSNDEGIKSIILDTISIIGKKWYVKELPLFFPNILSCFNMSKKVVMSAFQTLVSLSYQKNYIPKMKELQVLEAILAIDSVNFPEDKISKLTSNLLKN